MQNLLQSASAFGIVTGTLAILISSVIVLVPSAAEWFDVHMAVLAPIVSCLCYGNSLEKVVRKSLCNIVSVIFGGLLSFLWVVVLRMASLGIADTRDYNQYIAVGLSFPWLVVFYLFSPKLVIEVHTLTLIFMTITMYSGDYSQPDASSLRAILCGVVGCLVSIFVSTIGCIFFRSRQLGQITSFSSLPFDSAILAYFDALVDEFIRGSSTPSSDLLRDKCLNQIGLTESTGIYANVSAQMLKSYELLCAMRAVLRMHSADPLPGAICAKLVGFKKKSVPEFLANATDESLEIFSKNVNVFFENNRGTKSAQSMVLMGLFLKKFVHQLNHYECSVHILMAETTFSKIASCLSRNREPWSWVGNRSWIDAVRFALVLVALGEILVYWDARDETVDTYALWSFLPALLLAEIVESIGQAIVDGARYLLSVLLGSGMGALSLLMNGPGRLGYIVEFGVAIVIGLVGQEKIPKDAGIVFVISWIICVMGNMGLDPDETNIVDPEDTTGLNLLWRIALYRMAITSFAVFLMALSFIMLPKPWASGILFRGAKNCFGEARFCIEQLRTTKTKKIQKNHLLFLAQWTKTELPQLSLFSSAERRRSAELSDDPHLFPTFTGSLAALSGFAAVFGGLQVAANGDLTCDPSNLHPDICSLRATMELVMAEFGWVVARDLACALARARKYLALGQCSLLELRVVAAGVGLLDFAKAWVRLESALGMDENAPLACSQSFGDIPSLIPHNQSGDQQSFCYSQTTV